MNRIINALLIVGLFTLTACDDEHDGSSPTAREGAPPAGRLESTPSPEAPSSPATHSHDLDGMEKPASTPDHDGHAVCPHSGMVVPEEKKQRQEPAPAQGCSGCGG